MSLILGGNWSNRGKPTHGENNLAAELRSSFQTLPVCYSLKLQRANILDKNVRFFNLNHKL